MGCFGLPTWTGLNFIAMILVLVCFNFEKKFSKIVHFLFLAKNYRGEPFRVRMNLGQDFGKTKSGKPKPLRQMFEVRKIW